MFLSNKLTYCILYFLIAGISFDIFGGDTYNLRFEFPFGSNQAQTTVIRGSHVRSLISIESFVHEKKHVHATIQYPSELRPVNLCQYRVKGENAMRLPFELRTQNDIWYYLIEFEIDSSANAGQYEIICSIDSFPHYKNLKKTFFIVDENYVKTHIKIKKFIAPSDGRGNPLENQQKNTFIIKDQSSRFLRNFYITNNDHDGDHVAFQIENMGDCPVLLDVNYSILDVNNGQAVKWLDNLRQESGLDQDGINLQVFVGSHSVAKSVLTIKSRSNVFASGEFKQKISVSLFTSTIPFINYQQPLFIKKINAANVSSTVFAVVFAMAGILIMALFNKKIWGKLNSKEYILIAIYSAIAFTTVSVPSTVFSSIIHSFLGPFSFLFTGIFSEIISYMLLISLVVILPRAGVITSYLLVKFLLSSIVLGSFSLVTIIWYPMRALILEVAFYISGFFDNEQIFDNNNGRFTKKMTIIWVSCIIAVADAILAFVSLNMTMFFYRLYYAEWYVWLYVIIAGFLYTFLSVPLGIRLGMGLRKVVID